MKKILLLCLCFPLLAMGSFEQKTGRLYDTSHERVQQMVKPQERVEGGKPVLVIAGDTRMSEWFPTGDFGGYKVYEMAAAGLIMPYLNSSVLPYVSQGRYSVAIYSAGIEDIFEYQRPDEMDRNLFQSLSTLAVCASKVYVLTVPGVTEDDWYDDFEVPIVNAKVADYNKTIYSVAKMVGVTVIDMSAMTEDKGRLKEKYNRAHGFMYTREAYDAMYTIVVKAIGEAK